MIMVAASVMDVGILRNYTLIVLQVMASAIIMVIAVLLLSSS